MHGARRAMREGYRQRKRKKKLTWGMPAMSVSMSSAKPRLSISSASSRTWQRIAELVGVEGGVAEWGERRERQEESSSPGT
eukprot:3785529-Rhodomonas_salina.1